MTAPARPKCRHCHTQPVVKRIYPAAARAQAVDLAICECDFPHCRNDRCKKPVPFGAARCPHCGAA